MRQRFMMRSRPMILADASSLVRRFAGPEVPASPPHDGGLLGQARRPDDVAAHEGAALVNRVNVPRRATVVGRQPIKSAAMSVRERSCQSRMRPRKGPTDAVIGWGTALRRQADHGRGQAQVKT